MSVDALRPVVRRMALRAQDRATNWFVAGDRSVDDTAGALSAIVGVYANSAALLAADWYEDEDPDIRFDAILDEDMPEEKLASVAAWVFAGPQTPTSRIRVAAHRLVFDAARRTVFVNARNEGVAIARHELARCCDDCIARATVSARDRNSGSEDVDQDFHPGCEGLFTAVRSGIYAPPEYAREWRVRLNAARHAGNVVPDSLAKWLTAH